MQAALQGAMSRDPGRGALCVNERPCSFHCTVVFTVLGSLQMCAAECAALTYAWLPFGLVDPHPNLANPSWRIMPTPMKPSISALHQTLGTHPLKYLCDSPQIVPNPVGRCMPSLLSLSNTVDPGVVRAARRRLGPRLLPLPRVRLPPPAAVRLPSCHPEASGRPAPYPGAHPTPRLVPSGVPDGWVCGCQRWEGAGHERSRNHAAEGTREPSRYASPRGRGRALGGGQDGSR